MPQTPVPSHDAAILERLVVPDERRLSASAAKALLLLAFSPSDKECMRSLAAKARAGVLSDDEQAQVEAYSRIGSLLGIVKSKARRALKRRLTNGSAKTR